jgi:hypothetical protein
VTEEQQGEGKSGLASTSPRRRWGGRTYALPTNPAGGDKLLRGLGFLASAAMVDGQIGVQFV